MVVSVLTVSTGAGMGVGDMGFGSGLSSSDEQATIRAVTIANISSRLIVDIKRGRALCVTPPPNLKNRV